MKKKSNYNHNTSLRNPAIVMGAIGIFMIILIVIFNIKSKLNQSKITTQNQQTNQQQSSFIEIDKNSEYAQLVDKYIQALNEKDAEKLISLFPANESYTKTNAEQKISEMYTLYESQCGSNVKLSYEFGQVAKLNEDSLEDAKEQIFSVYKVDDEILEMYSLEVHLTKTGDINTVKETVYLNLAKIDNKWYIV